MGRPAERAGLENQVQRLERQQVLPFDASEAGEVHDDVDLQHFVIARLIRKVSIRSVWVAHRQWFVELYQASRRGDWAGIQATQSRINRIISIGLRYPVQSAVKEMLKWLGQDCGVCALPRRQLSAVEISDLHAALEASPLAAEVV